MIDALSRRQLLGLAGAVAVAGCLDAIDSADDEGIDESDDGLNGEADAEGTGEDVTDEGDGDEEDEAEAGDDDTDEGDDANDDEDADEEAIHEDYETTDVEVVDTEGEERGEVTAAIADTDELRALGLSDTDELPPDRGMLFVYDEPDERVFGMPEMDFGIDIIFADEDGEITEIHHASEPEPDEDGSEQRYPGYGQYVLEVIYEWTTEHGVEEGDVLEFELDD